MAALRSGRLDLCTHLLVRIGVRRGVRRRRGSLLSRGRLERRRLGLRSGRSGHSLLLLVAVAAGRRRVAGGRGSGLDGGLHCGGIHLRLVTHTQAQRHSAEQQQQDREPHARSLRRMRPVPQKRVYSVARALCDVFQCTRMVCIVVASLCCPLCAGRRQRLRRRAGRRGGAVRDWARVCTAITHLAHDGREDGRGAEGDERSGVRSSEKKT